MVDAPEKLFKASRGWFDNFKKRTGIHSVDRHGETASSVVKTAETFVKAFIDLIKKEGCIAQQAFVVH